jgi:hypothetical protein
VQGEASVTRSIQTYSGVLFDPLAPDPAAIDPAALGVEMEPWLPERAKAEFLARYERLEAIR